MESCNEKILPESWEVSVPSTWLETLLRYSKLVEKQMQELDSVDYGVFIKTDISALIGYASSAETIIKYNKTYGK